MDPKTLKALQKAKLGKAPSAAAPAPGPQAKPNSEASGLDPYAGRTLTIRLKSTEIKQLIAVKTAYLGMGKNPPADGTIVRAGIRALESLSAEQAVALVNSIQNDDKRKG